MKNIYLTIAFIFFINLFSFSLDKHDITTTLSTCQQDDYLALRALYLSTNGDNWKSQTDGNAEWPSASDFMANPTSPPPGFTDLEQWYGVRLDNTGCVDLLNLGNSNNLTGTIPAEIGDLINLTYLNFSTNNLSGSIPPEIGNLINLTFLSLRTNDITGSIPVEIGNLINLTSLRLNSNELSGSIPIEIGNLINLTSLRLSANQLSGSIPIEIGNLINLTSLRLLGNNLSGSIPIEIGNLVNLTSLALYSNDLSGSIPNEIGNLVNLTNLELNNNQLSGSIPIEIGNLINLTNLELDFNALTGSIPMTIGNLINLTTLELNDNQLSGSIPTQIGDLVLLSKLNLTNNQISGSIPIEIGSLINLTQLILSSNQIVGSIPTEIGNLINLNFLSFFNNQLSGSIPAEIGNLVDLATAALSDNQFSGSIPPEIGNLINLTFLNLSDNQLTGCLPSEIGSLTSLTTLNIRDNLLEGDIPASLANLVNVSTLILTDNDFTGCYDDSLASLCSQLPSNGNTSISNGNNFDAPWEDFCNSGAGACSLSQRITDSSNGCNLQDWEALKALYESTNGANWSDNSGWDIQLANQNMPPDDCNLADLFGITLDNNGRVSEIALPNNQLNGNLPPQIINLEKLTLLNLSNNQLNGCYPEILQDLCDQFSHADISLGNNFNSTWDNFCNSGTGVCSYDSSCFNFSGSVNRLVASSQIFNDIGSCNFSLEAWIQLEASNNNFVPILSNRIGASLPEITGVLFYVNSGGDLGISMIENPGDLTNYMIDNNGTFGATLKDGACHHIAISRNESILDFYIDGILIGSQNISNSPTLISQAPLLIGYDAFSGVALHGQLSEVKLWSSSRTATDIAIDMWETTPYNNDFLQAYWRLNEGDGQVAFDYSDNNYFATLGTSAGVDIADPQFGSSCCNSTPINDCVLSIYHEDYEVFDDKEFKAASKILSEARVNDVDYTAGDFISLKSGFNTEANFNAEVDPNNCHQDGRTLFLHEPSNNSIEIGNDVTFIWDVILNNLSSFPSSINYTIKVLEVVNGTSLTNSINANIVVLDQMIQLNTSDIQEVVVSSQQFQAGKNYIWQVSFTDNNNVIVSDWYNFAYKTTTSDFNGGLCSACDHAELFNGIDVKPEHERFPPIASSVSFQVLDELTECGENMRFVADFSDDPSIDTYHAIRIAGKKYVLRDDGQGADDIAGDGLFSIFLEENIEALQEDFDEQTAEFNAGTRVIFENRSLVDLTSSRMTPYGNPIDLGCGEEIVIDDPETGGEVGMLDHGKSLLITDLSVVEDFTRIFNPCTGQGDPDGVWTFGYLMRQMASTGPNNIASDAQASEFAINWLESWIVNNTVNGEGVSQRANMQNVIDDWLQKSNADGAPQGQLKMELAPFKLTAIVNRLDLRGSPSFESQNDGITDFNGGEGRFVFCALSPTCSALPFNVIFEFGIHKTSCIEYSNYAQEWAELTNLNFGDPMFNSALENITRQFTDAGSNPTKPNQNSINQIRTNENALAPTWELREFNLLSSGQIGIVPVKMEPAVKFIAKINNTDVQLLVEFINNQVPPIRINEYEVPEQFQGQDFLGGHSLIPFPPTGTNPHHWDAISPQSNPSTFIIDDADRHVFSLNTCSACHGGETQTFFTHVDPAGFGTEAGLSGFLTGVAGRGGAIDADGDANNNVMTVNDPADRPSAANPRQSQFNDLLRREADLNQLISLGCSPLATMGIISAVSFKPMVEPH